MPSQGNTWHSSPLPASCSRALVIVVKIAFAGLQINIAAQVHVNQIVQGGPPVKPVEHRECKVAIVFTGKVKFRHPAEGIHHLLHGPPGPVSRHSRAGHGGLDLEAAAYLRQLAVYLQTLQYVFHQTVPADLRVTVDPGPQVFQRPLPGQPVQRDGFVQYVGTAPCGNFRVQPGQGVLVDRCVFIAAPTQNFLGVIPILNVILLIGGVEFLNLVLDDVVDVDSSVYQPRPRGPPP